MYPVLFTLFGLSLTSFGVFLVIAIISALFIMWRLSRVFELDQERVLDLFFLVTLGAFIGSRVWYVLTNLPQFESFIKMVLIFKYSGLSFWGALLTGGIILRLIAPKLKLNYWQIADLAIVATFLAISITSFGCLLGGCQYGHNYDGFFAIHQFGLNGTQFPLQLLESGLFILGFIYLWNALLRFHFNGKIVSVGLIILGIMKLVLQPFRGDPTLHIWGMSLGVIMSVLTAIFGLIGFYLQSKRSFRTDLKFLVSLFYNKNRRKVLISKSKRVWYNFVVELQISLSRSQKNLKRSLRVRSTPNKF